jgi:hypothetical protein
MAFCEHRKFFGYLLCQIFFLLKSSFYVLISILSRLLFFFQVLGIIWPTVLLTTLFRSSLSLLIFLVFCLLLPYCSWSSASVYGIKGNIFTNVKAIIWVHLLVYHGYSCLFYMLTVMAIYTCYLFCFHLIKMYIEVHALGNNRDFCYGV